MKYWMVVLVNLLSVVLALVVVWVCVRESFGLVAFLLGVYFVWVVVRLVLRRGRG